MAGRALAVLMVLGAVLVGTVSPSEAGEPLSGVTRLTAARSMSCAVLADTTARCWGTGPLGTGGAFNETSATPVVVEDAEGEPMTGITQIAIGPSHVCVVLSDQTAACWGENLVGELGDGTMLPRLTPVPVQANAAGDPLTGVVELSLGDYFSCARLANGQARCWGQNNSTLGDGTMTNRRRPVTVKNGAGTGPLANVAQISAGADFACARLVDRTVRCWGQNGQAQLADGTNTSRRRPVGVRTVSGPGLLANVSQLAVGGRTACARLMNGQARCWGANNSGQRGTGSVTMSHQPLPLRPTVVVATSGSAALTGVAAVTVSGLHSCARLLTGQVRCFGRNVEGQVGDGTGTPTRPRARVVKGIGGVGNLTGVVEVALGDLHSCARRSDTTVVCWGMNTGGELGTGAPGPRRLTPVVVTAG